MKLTEPIDVDIIETIQDNQVYKIERIGGYYLKSQNQLDEQQEKQA